MFWSIVKKSLTLYYSCFSVSHGLGVYPSRTECLVYSSDVPRLAWDTLSYYDFSCLPVSWAVSLPQSTQTWYQRRHGSQPFAADCIGRINHYFGVRVTNSPGILCACHISGIPGWAKNRGEESWSSGLAVGAVMDCDHPLNCQMSVVWGGKWLPFSQVGGVPTSTREPHWWHINGVPNNVIKTWLMQISFFLFLARAFAPHSNDLIWSFSSWPLWSCQWPPDLVTWKTRHLELISRWRATWMGHPKAKRTLKRWEHWAVPPTCHLGPWPGGWHPPIPILDTALESM